MLAAHAVDDGDFKISRQREMLQAVVRDDHIDPFSAQQARCAHAIATNNHGFARAPAQQQRLIAHEARIAASGDAPG